MRRWVALNGDAYERAHVSRADSLRVDEDLYRTCVPHPDPTRALCLIVDTSQLAADRHARRQRRAEQAVQRARGL